MCNLIIYLLFTDFFKRQSILNKFYKQFQFWYNLSFHAFLLFVTWSYEILPLETEGRKIQGGIGNLVT